MLVSPGAHHAAAAICTPPGGKCGQFAIGGMAAASRRPYDLPGLPPRQQWWPRLQRSSTARERNGAPRGHAPGGYSTSNLYDCVRGNVTAYGHRDALGSHPEPFRFIRCYQHAGGLEGHVAARVWLPVVVPRKIKPRPALYAGRIGAGGSNDTGSRVVRMRCVLGLSLKTARREGGIGPDHSGTVRRPRAASDK
jgi:hypothetical protein